MKNKRKIDLGPGVHICSTPGCYQDLVPGTLYCTNHDSQHPIVAVPDQSTIKIYTTSNGPQVHVAFDPEGDVWLTEKEIGVLYDKSRENINMHIKSVLKMGGAITNAKDAHVQIVATSKDFLLVRHEGKRVVERQVKHYNLEMIMAIGHRTHSDQARSFRQWAQTHLTNVLRKGYTLADHMTPDQIDSLHMDIYTRRKAISAEWYGIDQFFHPNHTSVRSYPGNADQDSAAIKTRICFAITGQTPAQLITDRCDENKPNCGMNAKQTDDKNILVSLSYMTDAELARYNELMTEVNIAVMLALKKDLSLAALTSMIADIIKEKDLITMGPGIHDCIDDAATDILMRHAYYNKEL